MNQKKRLDSVGWIFFSVALVLYLPPCIYAIISVTVDALHIGIRVGTGIALAFFAAGFTSWIVNSILYYRAERLDARETPPKKPGKKRKPR